MHKPNYKALYRLQDAFLAWMAEQQFAFYLTGGTALSRFYLGHRFSDDLDFFVNADTDFRSKLQKIIGKLPETFAVSSDQVLITDDFCRLFLRSNDCLLKIEWVNDVAARWGSIENTPFGKIDSIANILANKITAIVGRDEPKDVFDIVAIAKIAHFSWEEVVFQAKQKAALNELEVHAKLHAFPDSLLQNAPWLRNAFHATDFQKQLQQLCTDLLLMRTNSLAIQGKAIEDILPEMKN
jgi:predicted nucleotidyltransferase component of viral defense system